MFGLDALGMKVVLDAWLLTTLSILKILLGHVWQLFLGPWANARPKFQMGRVKI